MPGEKDPNDRGADGLRSAYRGKVPDEYDRRLDDELAAMDKPPSLRLTPPANAGLSHHLAWFARSRLFRLALAGGLFALRGGSAGAIVGGMAGVLLIGGLLSFVWDTARRRAREAEAENEGDE